ncbi:hypothetical protein [Tuwongella immobilis]|uniref:Uncharacterized protein n=1 Tax=Tuwongella immobilis TaxID=692036 RepID=A0A6C2YIV1_9BACT|nr:hypothetical protein [Tuwongella immobilis]VIP01337.1 unnamed protein product [Tuwongella immobilis]VTR98104.1 unnamed protein product [Tuwongella immobilis]
MNPAWGNDDEDTSTGNPAFPSRPGSSGQPRPPMPPQPSVTPPGSPPRPGQLPPMAPSPGWETTSSATGSPSAASAPAPAMGTASAATAPAKQRRFGVAGVIHRQGELQEPIAARGQLGVIRLVNSGVGYQPPPLPLTWAAVPAEIGRFDLLWPDPPEKARTLAQLRDDLRQQAPTISSSDHPLMQELNAVGFALVDLAKQLHAADWRLGLLQPDNVAIIPGGYPMLVYPLDLGFTWRGSYGSAPWNDSPGRPDWLQEDPRQNPAAAIWAVPPVHQQFAAPGGSDYPPLAPQTDVKLLTRLFAWLLTEQFMRELPEVSVSSRAYPLWQGLKSVNSLDQLANLLRESPLSSHFVAPRLPPPPPPPIQSQPVGMTGVPTGTGTTSANTPSGGAKAMMLVLGLLLFGGAGFAGWWFTQGPGAANREGTDIVALNTPPRGTASAPTTTGKPTTAKVPTTGPKTGELVPDLVKGLLNPNAPSKTPEMPNPPPVASKSLQETLDGLAKLPLPQQAATLAKLYADMPANERPRELEQARTGYITRWIARYQQLTTEASEDLARRNEIRTELQQLRLQIESLSKTPSTLASLREKEQQCLDIIMLRAAE